VTQGIFSKPDSSPMILVLDDEPAVQILLTRFLEGEGFAVVTAATGADALTVLATHAERVALMIVDVKLPDMCGREFVHHAAARHGERPILYLSGVDQRGRTDALHQHTMFLPKPFANAELLARVHELLRDERRGE
jgi:DNA-binding response OmpR family regulator